MTDSQLSTPTAIDTAPQRPRFGDGRNIHALTASVAGILVSALVAHVSQPRGVVVAIHGGGSGSAYFDGQTHLDQSLLALGQRLGYTVLAIDRPGYGASAAQLDSISRSAQAEIVSESIDRFLPGLSDECGGIFLLAHSLGTQAACFVAANRTDVIGMETSGSAIRYKTDTGSSLSPNPTEWSQPGAVGRRLWGSRDLYPPGTIDNFRASMGAAPSHDTEHAENWPVAFASVAASITAPVRITMAEFEGVWSTSAEDLAALKVHYSRSPRVELHRQPAAGHNISLGWAARAYHLGALAFAEECYGPQELRK